MNACAGQAQRDSWSLSKRLHAPPRTTLWPVSTGGRCAKVAYDYAKAVTYEAVVRGLRLVVREAGLTGKVLTHSFRKLFAGRVYELTGHDVLSVKAALGHRDLKSTLHYLATDDAQLSAAIRDVLC